MASPINNEVAFAKAILPYTIDEFKTSSLVMNDSVTISMKQLMTAVTEAMAEDFRPSGILWPVLRSSIAAIPENLRRERLDIVWDGFQGHPETAEWSSLSFRQVVAIICSVMHLGEPPFQTVITFLRKLAANVMPDEWSDTPVPAPTDQVTFIPSRVPVPLFQSEPRVLRRPPQETAACGGTSMSKSPPVPSRSAHESHDQALEELLKSASDTTNYRLVRCSQSGCNNQIPGQEATACSRCHTCCALHGPCESAAHNSMKVQAFHEARAPVRINVPPLSADGPGVRSGDRRSIRRPAGTRATPASLYRTTSFRFSASYGTPRVVIERPLGCHGVGPKDAE